jgi:pimeloyl-ACP methyl ester carboxylesterase
MSRDYDIQAPDGRRLHVREDGDPDGVPLITLHGTPGSRVLAPSAIRSAAERGIRLIGYDRPGYGASSPHPGRRVVDAAADVETIADVLRLDRILVDGASGGGPHALACAARLPDRVDAVATYASVAPPDAEGLDFTAGMGEENVAEFGAAVAGREALEPMLATFAEGMLAATPEGLADELRTILSEADVAVVTGELAEHLHRQFRAGIVHSLEGWIDDDLEFVRPWGFDLAEIRIPVGLWQGEQDLMVPAAHGRWLADRIPGVDAHITAEDGHLTLITEGRVGEAHDWLLQHVDR